MTDEQWRPVVGHEGLYEVSDLGQVRGLDRIEQCGPRKRRRAGRALKQYLDQSGRPCIRLSHAGVDKAWRVHTLVAQAFLGPRPDGLLTRHLNDVRTDNRAVNLAYGTKSDNWHDAVANGVPGMRIRQTRCARDHALTGPNVALDNDCVACARMRSAVKSGYAYARVSSDPQEIADAYFAEIMGQPVALPRPPRPPQPRKAKREPRGCAKGHDIARRYPKSGDCIDCARERARLYTAAKRAEKVSA